MSERGDLMFERALVEAMVHDVGQPPADVLARVLGETAGIRPLPSLIAMVTAPPMVLPARVAVGVRRSRLLLVAAAILLVVAALVAGALLRRPPPAVGGWTAWGGGPGRAGAAVEGPTGRPQVRWAFDATAPIDSTPVIAGGMVLITSRDGTLHALDLGTGSRRWTAEPGAGSGGPAVDAGLVFVVDAGGSVHAYRLEDGRPAWTSVTLGAPLIEVAAGGGVVFQATRDGGVVALDAHDGAERWRAGASPSEVAAAGLALSDDLVLVATVDAGLVALRRATGEPAWSAAVDSAQPGTPVVADGLVWAGHGEDVKDGVLRAFHVVDGSPAWGVDEPLFAPAVTGGFAVSTSAIGTVSGRDAASGAEHWRFSPGGQFRQAAIAGGVVAALSATQRQVYGLDVTSGALRWQLPLDSVPGCCLAVADGVLVVGTQRGTLTAFEGADSEAGSAVPARSPSTPPTPLGSASPSSAPTSPGASPGASLAPVPLTVTLRIPATELGLGSPLGVAIAPSGDVFVTDETNRVTRLGPDGTVIARWGGSGDAPGELDFGSSTNGVDNARGAIAVGPDGLVYVSDSENHRVQVFTAEGGFVRAFGSLGSGPGQFTLPFDLSVDDAGNVYVLDDGAERITKFAPDGTAIWVADQSTDPRLLGHPHTAAFDSAGRLVVAIDDTRTIARLDPSTGRVVETLPNGGCEAAVDPWDRIYVVDCLWTTLDVLDASGRRLATDPTLGFRTFRLGADGRGAALAADEALVLFEITPP